MYESEILTDTMFAKGEYEKAEKTVVMVPGMQEIPTFKGTKESLKNFLNPSFLNFALAYQPHLNFMPASKTRAIF